MRTFAKADRISGILLLVSTVLCLVANAGVTNSVGWSDGFESYAVGTVLQATNGWAASQPGAGVVTNAPASANPLISQNIAAVTELLYNDVRYTSGGVAVVDVQVLPTWCDIQPFGDTNQHYALYVKTNQHLVVWQHSLSPVATNQWLELAASPLINTGVWTRFTVVLNYSNSLFQVRVNGGDPVTDPLGYQADGVMPNGSWFHMVKTNGSLSQVVFGDGGTNYVDDVMVTNRMLAWAPSGFAESVTNNGTIDNTHPVIVSLLYDTFSGSDGADLTPYVVVDSGLPDGLSLKAQKTSATTVALTLTNAATAHAAGNSVNNLAMHFADGAFTLGNASDVTGYRNTGLSVTFRDTAMLSYSTNGFRETNPANDGSINNTTPLMITLTNDVFTGPDGEDYGTNTAKLVISGMPDGLTGKVVKVDGTHLQMTVLGNAWASTSADDTSFTLSFLGAAFATNTVTGTVVSNEASMQVQYVDVRSLTYGTNTFVELPANDGSVAGTTVTLAYDTFTGNNGDDLSRFVSAPDLPAGLGLQAMRTSPTVMTLVFTNKASAHAASDSRIGNVTVHFLDGAFSAGNAAGVVQATRSDLNLLFHDQPVLTMPGGLTFTESSQNNGSIANTLTIALAGDAFAADLTGCYTVNNLPDGLVPQVTRDSDTQITLALTQKATSHTAAQSTSNVQFTFLNGAFANVAAANIMGATTNFTVTFANAPSLAYSRTTFDELSFGTIDNRDPMTITVSGDTFASAPGGDFSSLVSVGNLPSGLAAVFTRISDTRLGVTLTGSAGANASLNTIHNLAFTFLQGAFTHTDADQVGNYTRSDLSVVFVDDSAFVNTIPYREPFEGYPNGFLLAGTNAWTADYYADAAQVTNGTVQALLLTNYYDAGGTYPITTNHAKALFVRDSVRTEVHSSTGALVYLDFLMIPVAMQEVPENNTNHQFAFYVNTNRQLVIWHRNTTSGSSVNEWLALTNNTPLINTSAWNRFTVAQNYTNMMFQIRLNEGTPIVDAAGWDAAGLVRTGSWFHMVNTNAPVMSRVLISGMGSASLDDLTVVSGLPASFGRGIGSVFKYR